MAKKRNLRIELAQMNTKVCDVSGNLEKIKWALAAAEAEKVDLLVTPELSLSGYPLEDAVENPDVLKACENALETLIDYTRGMSCGVVVGVPVRRKGGKIFNTSILIQDGHIVGYAQKKHRPNYGVFDEVRNFTSGERNNVIDFKGHKIGIVICEDTWKQDVSKKLADQGAELLISVNSSPYETEKHKNRKEHVVKQRCLETGLPMIYLNQVGGQDEIIFDGGSFVCDQKGNVVHEMKAFQEQSTIFDVSLDDGFKVKAYGVSESFPDSLESDYTALVVAVRDYCKKTGMKSVCLGMSGGVDSALVAAIAADALGAENVLLVSMPSKFTAGESNTLAYEEAERLGAKIISIPIQTIANDFMGAVVDGLGDDLKRQTIENFQARTRGTLLMGISNNNPGMMVLSTGNKSENAVGYATLYGDMNGGYNPLKDVLKTRVFELCHWRNAHTSEIFKGPKGEIIPVAIINRPPSAELFENQKDSDSLPPYPILDDIIVRYAEKDQPIDQIIREVKLEESEILRTIRMIDIAQYKRNQSCPGPKIRSRNFGRDRRWPIAGENITSVHKYNKNHQRPNRDQRVKKHNIQ